MQPEVLSDTSQALCRRGFWQTGVFRRRGRLAHEGDQVEQGLRRPTPNAGQPETLSCSSNAQATPDENYLLTWIAVHDVETLKVTGSG
jgi:hypothetical protein